MRLKIFALLPVVCCLTGLIACSPPPARVHEVLRVSDKGEYSFKGATVPREQLRATLEAERQKQSALYADISASPNANIEAVKFAVETLKAAEIRFSFFDERVMTSGKSGGEPAE